MSPFFALLTSARKRRATLHRLLWGGAVIGGLVLTNRVSAAVPPATARDAGPPPGSSTEPVNPALARLAPRISVLTFEPGDATFSKFGHNAIRVQSSRYSKKRQDLVYNYGTFRFDSPFLILDFLTGRFRYWLSVSTMPRTLTLYRSQNRTVIEQELALTPLQALRLAAFLRTNALPENRDYLYDYYRDNCSTRVRDAIDRVLGGALKRQLTRRPGTLTYREHTLRLTAEHLPLFMGLDVAMNDHIDRPITVWDEAFLPGMLREALSEAVVPRGGSDVPMVTREQTLFQARREPPRAAPPGWLGYFLGAGLALGGMFVGLAAGARRVPWLTLMLGSLAGVLGLVAGVLGLLFLGLWLGTNHDVAYHNENLLLCAPWALALTPLSPGLARGRPEATRRAFFVAASLGITALLALAIKALPFAAQDNSRILALLVPTWLGLALALRQLTRGVKKTDQPAAPLRG